MKINSLCLCNFRSFSSLNIKFCDGLNIFIGDNAAGKTNILEAIYFLAITKPIVHSTGHKLIKNGCESTSVKGSVYSNSINYELEVRMSNDGNVVFINGHKVNRLIDYINHLRIILFSPSDIKYFRDYPLSRRRIFNIDISLVSSSYLKLLNSYNYLLKQRNSYLKGIYNDNFDINYLTVLNKQLAEFGYKVFVLRSNFIKKINNYLKNIYFDISGFNGLSLDYISLACSLNQYIYELNNSTKMDLKYHITSFGIHRDDFKFNLNGLDLVNYGSQGQLRMAVLAYKISLVKVYSDYGLDSPLLLLDDVFSELDVNKRNKITKYLSIVNQVIITTTDLHMIDKAVLKDACVFTIENGNVTNIIKDGEINE